jgi:hypothetical protein
MTAVPFSALVGRANRYEVDGVALVPVRYDARISLDEHLAAEQAVLLGSCLDTLNCRLRWHGAPARCRA